MRVQVLVAAMHQHDHSLLGKMNLRSDAIIANQCDHNSVEEFQWNGHSIKYLNFAERGVGLNRNNALMRADGDICLFADDDMRYCDDYVSVVTKAFADHPDADVLIFNLIEKEQTRQIVEKFGRVRWYNFLRYGTARVAVRNGAIQGNGIYFNQCFGGGTPHCHGEDNLFLATCLQKGLKMYAVPAYIAELTDERPSSWNTGYDEKYLRDQGALYKTLSRKWWKLLCLQDLVRHPQIYKTMGLSFFTAWNIMRGGGNEKII